MLSKQEERKENKEKDIFFFFIFPTPCKIYLRFIGLKKRKFYLKCKEKCRKFLRVSFRDFYGVTSPGHFTLCADFGLNL